MPPQFGYDPIATVQQAITGLLLTHEPQFLGIGLRMYLSFATVVLSWYGMRMMLAPRHAEDHLNNIAAMPWNPTPAPSS